MTKTPELAALSLLLLGTAAAPAFAQEYTITDLTPAVQVGDHGVHAAALNAWGEVAGSFDLAPLWDGAPTQRHGFLLGDGPAKKIYTPGFAPLFVAPDVVSSAGVNSVGDVVGSYYSVDPVGDTRAFVQLDDPAVGMVDLGTLGGSYTIAEDINTARQIVGYASLSNGAARGFLHQGGVMSALPTLGGTTGFAQAINERGQITGCAEVTGGRMHAFRYHTSPAAIFDLGAFGGDSCGVDINNSGQVAGWAMRGFNATAVVHDGIWLFDIGASLGADASMATAIGSSGDVVGWYWAAGFRGTFLYRADEGTAVDLDTLLPPGVHVTDAHDINASGQILVTAEVQGVAGRRALLLTPKVLDRFAYAFADQPTAAQYTAWRAYNASGGAIVVHRFAPGLYQVDFADLPGWGPNVSSAVSVSTVGSSRTTCSMFSQSNTIDTLAVYVTCNDLVTNAATDSKFLVMVTGNAGVEGPSAFLMSGGAQPDVSPLFSWNATRLAKQQVTRAATGVYDVLMGTGNVLKSAKLVTASSFPATTCNYAKGISGGVQVRCYDTQGAAVDSEFTVVQLAGGRPGRRLGFALANLPTTASYVPTAQASFNSSGGAITATRSAVGRYAVTFAGLGSIDGEDIHVQVTPMLEAYRAACNAISWGDSPGGLRVEVECKNGAGQYLDTRYDVLVIE